MFGTAKCKVMGVGKDTKKGWALNWSSAQTLGGPGSLVGGSTETTVQYLVAVNRATQMFRVIRKLIQSKVEHYSVSV